MHRAWSIQQLNRSVALVIEVSCVSNIIFVTSVDLVFSHVGFRAILVFLLLLNKHQLSCEERPGQNIALLVESGKESFLLAPSQVIVLLTHTDTLDKVLVEER